MLQRLWNTLRAIAAKLGGIVGPWPPKDPRK
jgi:hypothetical protein